MKSLNGRELSDYITERQARQVRALRQANRIFPKLAIIQTTEDPVIDTYVRLKQRYGADILVDVDIHKIAQSDLLDTIQGLNEDTTVHGVIIQLPLSDPSQTDQAVTAVAPAKDVDGLGDQSPYDPATPMAINWLLAGYNVDLKGKTIAIVGNGRLVGRPLTKLWQASGYDITVFDDKSDDMKSRLPDFDIIVTATGVPGLIVSTDVKQNAVIVDAGTASENGTIVGDVAEDVRSREDVTITPVKGGVGPLTVTALFDNVIAAAQSTAK